MTAEDQPRLFADNHSAILMMSVPVTGPTLTRVMDYAERYGCTVSLAAAALLEVGAACDASSTTYEAA